MSYEWEASSDDIGVQAFEVWEIKDVQEANEAIALRVEGMQRMYQEMVEIAERFDISINFVLQSDLSSGHNIDAQVYWNPSSQHC